MNYTNLVIHYDEIGLKKGNRDFFEKKLVDNLKCGLGENKTTIIRERGQIIVNLSKDNDYNFIKDKLSVMPGISSFLFSIETENDIEKIRKCTIDYVKNTDYKDKSFRIETKRHNKGFKQSSTKVSQILGRDIQDNYRLEVDLTQFDICYYIEICEKKTYIGHEKINGVGGIAVGSAAKMLSLISGGIDSPVASYMMMKRGVKVTFIHFQNRTQTTKSSMDKVEKIVKRLSEIQCGAKLYIIPFEEIQKNIIVNISAKYRMLIYRRFMIRIAEKVAKREKIKALITGDSLSQVASQTVENMEAINECLNLMRISPLIGLNKNEIINISKKIGTFKISILPYNDCCSFFIAKNPETKARVKDIIKIEKNLEIEKLVDIGYEKKIIKKFNF